jgi:hypothetical protein
MAPDNLLIFYTITAILLLTGAGCLIRKNIHGCVPLGLGIALAGLFVTSPVAWAYIIGGILTIPAGYFLKKE